MVFDTFADFVAMGGYGFYVWISFGLSFFTLLVLGAWSLWYKKRLFTVARQEIQRIERIKAARQKRKKQSEVQQPDDSE